MNKYQQLWENCLQFGIMQIREEVLAFLEFLDKENISNLLEIGLYSGATLFLWSSLAQKNGIKIGIDDPYANDIIPKRTLSEMEIIKSIFHQSNINAHFILKDSHKQETFNDVLNILEGNQLDFLFLDGDHTYEGVKMDYEMYSPLVKNGGLIAFHDIIEADYPKKNGIEVYKFWQEIKEDKIEFIGKQKEWGGIGCLRK